MKWKPEEYEFIIYNYLIMTQPELAIALGRSLDSVKQYMSRNGITLPEDVKSKRFRNAINKTRSHLGGMEGANNPNWKGGRSKNNYYYRLRQKERFPERVEARDIVTRAIRSGKIKKEPCSVCGVQYSQAHHEDYSKPLEIIWLCPEHHRARHYK